MDVVKYGIVFNHPCDRSRGLKRCVDCLADGKRIHKKLIMIEVRSRNFDLNNNIVEYLNFHYRPQSSLFDLQECGVIFDLNKSPHLCDSELSRFKQKYNNLEKTQYVDRITGDIVWQVKTTDDCIQQLKIPLLCFNDLEDCIIQAKKSKWDFVLLHDIHNKTFKVINIK